MGRFSEFIRNGPVARATRGNPWPLAASVIGGALGGPAVGQLVGNWVGNRIDRRDRRNAVPFSPSPEDANSPQQLRDQLGLMNWSGGGASPSGQYGPMADGYAGLPQAPADPAATPQYDPNMTQNLVDGYQSGGLMGGRPLASMRGVTDGGTRGFGVQSTTDIGGTLAALSAFGNTDSGGSNGNYYEWLARHRPGPQF